MVLLNGNSNNNPEVFSERIFKPISGDGWQFYYSTIIVIIGLYFCLKQLNKIRESSKINTFGRRIIAIMVLMFMFSAIWEPGIKFYKRFSSNLNSIYIDREKTKVDFNANQDKLTVSGRINIINCI